MTDTRFTTDHQWVRLQGGVATVGITDFAQDALGAVTLVRLPRPGRRVRAGEACAAVETVKAANDVPAALDGVVVDANAALPGDPALVNADAEGAGWLYRLTPDDPADVTALMDTAAYGAFLAAL